jgi:hypothetical protein
MHVISIDPGSKRSGLSIIMLNSDPLFKLQIAGFNVDNELIVDEINKHYVKYKSTVVIEDIRPYGLKMSNDVINTCKWIGELNYRLITTFQAPVEYVTRGAVKKWVYEQFTGLCNDRINKKIAYLDDYGDRKGKKRYRTKEGLLKKPSFHWVDDRIVIAAMKELWKIPTPTPGRKNIYGLSEHSWQALAAGSCFLSRKLGAKLIEYV